MKTTVGLLIIKNTLSIQISIQKSIQKTNVNRNVI